METEDRDMQPNIDDPDRQGGNCNTLDKDVIATSGGRFQERQQRTNIAFEEKDP